MPRDPLLCLVAALAKARGEAGTLMTEARMDPLAPMRIAMRAAQVAHELQEAALITLAQIQEGRTS